MEDPCNLGRTVRDTIPLPDKFNDDRCNPDPGIVSGCLRTRSNDFSQFSLLFIGELCLPSRIGPFVQTRDPVASVSTNPVLKSPATHSDDICGVRFLKSSVNQEKPLNTHILVQILLRLR